MWLPTESSNCWHFSFERDSSTGTGSLLHLLTLCGSCHSVCVEVFFFCNLGSFLVFFTYSLKAHPDACHQTPVREDTSLTPSFSSMLPSPARKDLAWWCYHCYEIQTLASAESLQITTRLHLNWPSSASRWLLAHPLKALSGQPVNDSLWGTLLLVLNQGHSLIREMSQASGLGSSCQLLY